MLEKLQHLVDAGAIPFLMGAVSSGGSPRVREAEYHSYRGSCYNRYTVRRRDDSGAPERRSISQGGRGQNRFTS
jgi:hypothetical protein